ncbi:MULTISPECIES: rolling circle replication-associated protein [Chitinophagaceae]
MQKSKTINDATGLQKNKDVCNVGRSNISNYTLSATKCVALSSNKSVHRYGGSSLLRVRKDKQTVETLEKSPQTSVESLYEVSDMEADFFPQDAGCEVSGDAQPLVPRKLSPRSRNKLFNRIFFFIRGQKKTRFPFLTLSFISGVSDRAGVKCLNKFLTAIRKEIKGFQYVWVAERQENGNIHFHLVLNTQLDVKRYNALWVIQQYNEGIINEKYSFDDVMNHWKAGTMQKILNPLDIRWAKSVGGVVAYLTKYVTKNKAEFQCSCWHCSRGVSQLCTSKCVDCDVWNDCGDKGKNCFFNQKTCKHYVVEDYASEYAIVRNILNKEYYDKYLSDVHDLNSWILDGRKPSDIPNIQHREFVIFHLTN